MQRICEICGSQFKRHAGHTKQRFCSIKCASVFKRGLSYPHYHFSIICLQCEKEKVTPNHKHVFCSVSCAKRYANNQRKTANRTNGFWLNYREAKKELLKHHKACQRCDWNEVIEVLELHHIDGNRRNNHINNLMLICPNCHTIEHFQAGTGQFKNNRGRSL